MFPKSNRRMDVKMAKFAQMIELIGLFEINLNTFIKDCNPFMDFLLQVEKNEGNVWICKLKRDENGIQGIIVMQS